MASLKKITRSLRKRFFPNVQDVLSLGKEVTRLREEVAHLRGLLAAPLTNSLQARISQLEVLLTEHPKINSPGLAKRSFPSPVVSVIMPTWNRAGFISDAILSVQAQTFADWELLIIDDGSTDDTEKIVARFADDRRIRYVKQPRSGVSKARNHALRLAQGSIIAYLDSDNLWYPGFLEAVVNTFAADSSLESAYGAVITEAHGDGNRILFRPFDRAELLKANYIDGNAFVHRRSLVETCGGWDEKMDRLLDWDLILRYTQRTPARAIPVLAARYRALDEHRVTTAANLGFNMFQVSRKWATPAALPRPIRVLYILWHYPQLSESYIESEIRCMQRWGVHVEVWSEVAAASPYEISVPVHRGTLEEAIAASKPDILHVHWINIALDQGERLSASGIPVTVRAHGFEVTPDGMRKLLSLSTLRRAFFFPHQIVDFQNEPRFVPMACAFDTSLFQPEPEKDRHLVVRTSAGLPSKDLDLFFEVAKRVPSHRFVLAVVTCLQKEAYIGELAAMIKRMDSPVEMMVDVPREKIAQLLQRSAFYLHTAVAPESGGTPLGMPISIAEAMATGAHVLIRDFPPFVECVGPAGSTYRDAKQVAAIITESATWPESKWKQLWNASVDRAFMHYADERVLQPLYNEWCSIVQAQQKGAAGAAIREA